MSGGGGTTVNETKVSGLSDSQFNNLQSGQGLIRQDIQTVGNASQQAVNNLKGDMNVGFTNLSGDVRNVDRSVTNLGSTVDRGFNNMGNQLTTLGNNVGNQIVGLGSNIDTRFNNLGTELTRTSDTINNNLNAGLGTINQNMKTGFDTAIADTRQGFADTRAALNSGFADTNKNIDSGFETQGRAIDAGFQNQANRMDTMQTNVLGGQAGIRSLVEQYGGNLDRYYADLAASQADQTQRLGGLQTGLDTFRDDFRTSDTLATQQRARLADSVAGGINAVREDLGATANTLGNQTRAVENQVAGVTSQMDQQGTMAAKNFANIARDIATGFGSNDQQSVADRNDFISRLNAIRTLVTDGNVQVDDTIRAQYGQLAQSFDAQGRLIQRSVTESGNQIARALDAQGTLLLAEFDTNGQRVQQQALDINRMMRMLDSVGYRSTSPATGLASPYYTTR
jgi:hypothetical protein